MATPKPFTVTGEPTKRTLPIVKRVIQATELGAPRWLAARYGGISPSTLYLWMATYKPFREMMQEAEAKNAMRLLARIEAASVHSWAAAAWKLERLNPEEYGRTTRTEVSGDPQAALRHAHSADDGEMFDEVIARLSPGARQELRKALEAVRDDRRSAASETVAISA